MPLATDFHGCRQMVGVTLHTVGRVAERLGRHWLGIELSAAYGEMAKRRTEGITQSIFL